MSNLLDRLRGWVGPGGNMFGLDSIAKDCKEAANRIEELEVKVIAQQARIEQLREKLEQLARLGNGNRYGNSIGNLIAQEALCAPDDLSTLRTADHEYNYWNLLTNPTDIAEMCARLNICITFHECIANVECLVVSSEGKKTARHSVNHDGTLKGKLKAWMEAATTVAAKIGGCGE